MDALKDAHMVFITCGMGGGTGTGAAPVVAEICAEMDILTVAVVTKPFAYEGRHRNNLALEGISTLFDRVDTLIVVPNENLFKLCDKNTTHDEAMGLANDVLLAGVKSITDLMTLPGSINLDFADVRAVMKGKTYMEMCVWLISLTVTLLIPLFSLCCIFSTMLSIHFSTVLR